MSLINRKEVYGCTSIRNNYNLSTRHLNPDS